jgi:hypothetical protein
MQRTADTSKLVRDARIVSEVPSKTFDGMAFSRRCGKDRTHHELVTIPRRWKQPSRADAGGGITREYELESMRLS